MLVRLVRACGSKRKEVRRYGAMGSGQARKSLWIETIYVHWISFFVTGQASKRLWIETSNQIYLK